MPWEMSEKLLKERERWRSEVKFEIQKMKFESESQKSQVRNGKFVESRQVNLFESISKPSNPCRLSSQQSSQQSSLKDKST
jgi:hypothetical protein